MRNGTLGLAAVIGLISVRADAAMITFNDIVPTESIQTSIDSQGFNFASGHFHTYGCGHLFDGIASNDSTHLGYESVRGRPIVMTNLDGGLFSLFSLDVSEFYARPNNDRPNAQLISVTGYTSSGSAVGYSFNLDGVVDGPGGAIDFQHLALPDIFVDLTSVTFTGLLFDGRDGGIALDNIQYNSVPEPGTLALTGLGLLWAGATRRGRYPPS